MANRTPMTTAGLSAPGSTANAILPIATKPAPQSPQYAAWIEQQDFIEFLRAGRRSEEVVLYAGLTHCFLYPVTASQEEWANELMALDQLVVEGLNRSYFKSKAEAVGITVEPQWGSLKPISEVLLHAQVYRQKGPGSLFVYVAPIREVAPAAEGPAPDRRLAASWACRACAALDGGR